MMAATIATMNAPVATNKLNFALATKNTISGPSSVASLNSGCGCFLSMSGSNSCDRLREISRGEWREIIDAFTDTNEMHRQLVPLRKRDQDAAPRGSVELGHDKARDPCDTMKRLDLR